MKQYRFEIEDDYGGSAWGAWIWIAGGAACWVGIIWLCF